nr:MAG TPA: hypothetical protein [Caudoviricetes sp.]
MKYRVIVPRVPALELLDARMPMVDESLEYELGVCRWSVRSASDEGAELVLQPNDGLLIPAGGAAGVLDCLDELDLVEGHWTNEFKDGIIRP